MAARAQAPDPQLIPGTVPLATDVMISLQGYLQTYPPSPAPFYAPTYSQPEGASTLVSLVGLNIQSADDPWVIEAKDDAPSNVVWIGTVRIFPDGSGQMFSAVMRRAAIPHLAALTLPEILPAPGGGPEIHLPWQTGASMMYGPRLIHGSGDYGTTGMNAVDWVGGTGMGTNVAPDLVYASQTGTVDYVCTDDTQKAIRTYNASTDDYFVYAHLKSNSNLVLDHVFSQGAGIGSLVHGTFDDSCGWAEQAATVYHVHWMFEPAGGAYAVAGCTLRFADKKWHCGDEVIGAGGWVTNTATGGGADDPAAVSTPSIWDNIIGAFGQVLSWVIAKFPAHASTSQFLNIFVNTCILVFRLLWLLVRPSLNLVFFVSVLLALFAENLLFGIIWLIFWIIRVIRIIKQTIPVIG